ncbi:MAG: sulfatase [Verrucomicrobiales bacterium]|nr:sulfatase [Verrucomicrobiales bacterium]
MKTLLIAILATLSAAPLGALYAADQPNAARPNFIVIFIDDLGFADIQPFSDRHPTPNLARMAEEGRTFTSFYSASSVCTPSRAGIMTGSYPARISMLFNETRDPLPHASVLWPGSRKGLNPDEITIAEVLRDRGFATACIGKWHLGDQPVFLPTRQGFDEFFGIPNGHDMGVKAAPFNLPPPMVENETVIEDLNPEDFGYLTKRFTEYAIAFIERHQENPFFIYLSHNMVHGPHAASPAFLDKTGKGLYADTVAEMDWSVGQILDRLVELGIDERTLVLFTSDNGGGLFPPRPGTKRRKPPYSSNAPYSGGKATPAEGGFRVPTIGWWPGTIEAGSSTDLMASTLDLLPTFAALTGDAFEPPVPIDGVDISCLFGTPLPTTSPRNTFAYYGYFDSEHQYRDEDAVLLHAVREGRWKYYPKPTRFLQAGTEELLVIERGALFDLKTDPGETFNFAGSHPDVIDRMRSLTQSYIEKLGDDGKPGSEVRPAGYVEEGKPLNFK